MRSVILRSLAVIGAGALVLAGVLYVASTVDARPPEVLEVNLTQPLDDDPRVGLITTSLEVVFSEPVETDSAASALSIDPEVEGAVSWSGSTLIFTPREPLDLETAYTVHVAAGVRDVAGNEMTEQPPDFEFRTAGRPTLVEADPADGATDAPVDQPIALTFSGLMDTSSVEAQLRLRPAFPHTLRWSGELLEIVPTVPLRPDAEYEIDIQAEATDVAGVALGEPISISFRTVSPGLTVETLVPADGVDGIATISPIAVIFDRPVDPASVGGDQLEITPEVAGSISVVPLPDEPASDDESGRAVVFTPSGPLPPNTTFDVTLRSGVTSTGGGGLGAEVSWSFTTGAPVNAVSNQITFITDRAGVENVWAMNRDGTGQRQLSAELAPVLDYAIAPDGSSLVVADGRRLVYLRSDGSDRRILTDQGLLEFDPAYSPNGQEVVFARADAETGAGLGLWTWQVDAGDPQAVELPDEIGAPAPSESGEGASALRAPRYSPDGGALAFVDESGFVGLLELPAARLTRVPFAAAAPPVWLPSSAGVLLTGRQGDEAVDPEPFEAPVTPLAPTPGDRVARLTRSGTSVSETAFGPGSHVLAVASDGQIAYTDAGGSLHLTDASSTPSPDAILDGDPVAAAAFAPGEPAMVVVLGEPGAAGRLELVELDGRRRTPLARDGSQPRWLP